MNGEGGAWRDAVASGRLSGGEEKSVVLGSDCSSDGTGWKFVLIAGFIGMFPELGELGLSLEVQFTVIEISHVALNCCCGTPRRSTVDAFVPISHHGPEISEKSGHVGNCLTGRNEEAMHGGHVSDCYFKIVAILVKDCLAKETLVWGDFFLLFWIFRNLPINLVGCFRLSFRQDLVLEDVE